MFKFQNQKKDVERIKAKQGGIFSKKNKDSERVNSIESDLNVNYSENNNINSKVKKHNLNNVPNSKNNDTSHVYSNLNSNVEKTYTPRISEEKSTQHIKTNQFDSNSISNENLVRTTSNDNFSWNSNRNSNLSVNNTYRNASSTNEVNLNYRQIKQKVVYFTDFETFIIPEDSGIENILNNEEPLEVIINTDENTEEVSSNSVIIKNNLVPNVELENSYNEETYYVSLAENEYNLLKESHEYILSNNDIISKFSEATNSNIEGINKKLNDISKFSETTNINIEGVDGKLNDISKNLSDQFKNEANFFSKSLSTSISLIDSILNIEDNLNNLLEKTQESLKVDEESLKEVLSPLEINLTKRISSMQKQFLGLESEIEKKISFVTKTFNLEIEKINLKQQKQIEKINNEAILNINLLVAKVEKVLSESIENQNNEIRNLISKNQEIADKYFGSQIGKYDEFSISEFDVRVLKWLLTMEHISRDEASKNEDILASLIYLNNLKLISLEWKEEVGKLPSLVFYLNPKDADRTRSLIGKWEYSQVGKVFENTKLHDIDLETSINYQKNEMPRSISKISKREKLFNDLNEDDEFNSIKIPRKKSVNKK